MWISASRMRIPIYSGRLFALLVFWSATVATPTFAEDDITKDTLLGRAFEMTELLLHRCLDDGKGTGKDILLSVPGCLQRRTLVALDRMIAIDHLRIYDGVELVKRQNETVTDRTIGKTSSPSHTWMESVTSKLGKIFHTHSLKLHFKPNAIIAEARRRNHHHMMPLIMFGTLAISMIAIPLGFQFLAVLGGKALLLAKLALILTSIQGLKRIATSNLNYGLYQAPHASAWHGYDRRWNYDFKDDPYKHTSYDQPDSVLDLLHPMSPRSTSGYEPTE